MVKFHRTLQRFSTNIQVAYPRPGPTTFALFHIHVQYRPLTAVFDSVVLFIVISLGRAERFDDKK